MEFLIFLLATIYDEKLLKEFFDKILSKISIKMSISKMFKELKVLPLLTP